MALAEEEVQAQGYNTEDPLLSAEGWLIRWLIGQWRR